MNLLSYARIIAYNLILALCLLIFVGCQRDTPLVIPEIDVQIHIPTWQERVKEAQIDAYAHNSALHLHGVYHGRHYASEYAYNLRYIGTQLSFINHDTNELFIRDFTIGGFTNELTNTEYFTEPSDLYLYIDQVKLDPKDIVEITQPQLELYLEQCGDYDAYVSMELLSDSNLPEHFSDQHKIIWLVEYHIHYSPTSFYVWVDAETGEVVETKLEEDDWICTE